jgi:hypothetical protein
MIPARGLLSVDLAGQPIGCLVGEGFDNSINAMVQVGNAIYVTGPFLRYRGQSANHIAKIDITSCALDTTFSPSANNGFDADTRTMIARGNSIYVGGLFTTYRGASANYVAKLDATTGALDTTFDPPGSNGTNSVVQSLLAIAGDIYISGEFTSYRGAPANAIARVDSMTGLLDTALSPEPCLITLYMSAVDSCRTAGLRPRLAFLPSSIQSTGLLTRHLLPRVQFRTMLLQSMHSVHTIRSS